MDMIRVRFIVNGEPVSVVTGPNETLLETLRERLGLTGAKEGCGLGACGSCTVLFNGEPIRSCITLTGEVEGAEIRTVEGLADGDQLTPVQEAFMEEGAIQCGFCTAGMVLTATALLERNEQPSREDIVRSISSNTCRCTGYKKMLQAVERAATGSDRGAR